MEKGFQIPNVDPVITRKNFLLTVGTYFVGNSLVEYDTKRHVLPTAPSPTTTHLITFPSVVSELAILVQGLQEAILSSGVISRIAAWKQSPVYTFLNV